FLARVVADGTEPSSFLLKGGYAMELRITHARATRDVDLTCRLQTREPQQALAEVVRSDLQRLASADLNDFFTFQVGEAKLELDGPPYGGVRYPVTTMLAGRLWIQFQLDVGVDVVVAPPERLLGKGWLEFCGIPAPVFTAIALEQQFAEKIHAYTLPRPGSRNTRVKDLIDLVLLIRLKTLTPEPLHKALLAVFKVRSSHPMPTELPLPPLDWQVPFADLAAECDLSLTLSDAFSEVNELYIAVQNSAEQQNQLVSQ
ncbi:MAG: nucleotidyl transferase AbiEii/AbiGii toxin family protein, partial [Chlamydiia bacterium]